MGEISSLLASREFLAGMLSSFIVLVVTGLVRQWVGRFRFRWQEWRSRSASALADRHRKAVEDARRDDRYALLIALGELRKRHRSQASLLWCILMLALAGFVLFVFLEMDSVLRIPPLLSIFFVGLMTVMVGLFVGSLGEDRSAAFLSTVLDEVLVEAEERLERCETDGGDEVDRRRPPVADREG